MSLRQAQSICLVRAVQVAGKGWKGKQMGVRRSRSAESDTVRVCEQCGEPLRYAHAGKQTMCRLCRTRESLSIDWRIRFPTAR